MPAPLEGMAVRHIPARCRGVCRDRPAGPWPKGCPLFANADLPHDCLAKPLSRPAGTAWAAPVGTPDIPGANSIFPLAPRRTTPHGRSGTCPSALPALACRLDAVPRPAGHMRPLAVPHTMRVLAEQVSGPGKHESRPGMDFQGVLD